MPKTVYCQKLKKDAEALERQPYPGELGKRILANVSKEGWQLWLDHQTMLINENHLSMADKEARKFLAQEMEAFFFGDGSATPEGYTPKSNG